MNFWRATVFLCTITMTSLAVPSHAASTKEINAALSDKFEITKRSLSGEISNVGTVLHLNIEGVTAERPMAMVRAISVENGQVLSASTPQGKNRIDLPIGEPMHVYSIRVSKDKIRLQLGTEMKYPSAFLGGTQYVHFQTALEFRIVGNINETSVDDILNDISKSVVTEEEAKRQPDLVAAIEEVREANAQAAEKRQETKESARSTQGAQQTVQTKKDSGRWQPVQDAKPAPEPQQKVKETKRISCEAANWEGTVENIADLFECDSLKAMQALAEGRQILFYVSAPKFGQGKFSVSMVSTPTYLKVFTDRSLSQQGNIAAFMDVTQNQKRYSVTCLFPTDQIGNLQQNATVEARATLDTYSGTMVTLNCTL